MDSPGPKKIIDMEFSEQQVEEFLSATQKSLDGLSGDAAKSPEEKK